MPNRWRQTEREVIDTLLRLKHASTKEIAEVLGLSHKWVEDKIRILREAKRIYIADWKKFTVAGDYRIIWALGNEPDMPKPKPRTHRERQRDWRRRRRLKEQQWHLTQ